MNFKIQLFIIVCHWNYFFHELDCNVSNILTQIEEIEWTPVTCWDAASHLLWMSLWFLNVNLSFPVAQRQQILMSRSVVHFSGWLRAIWATSYSSRDLKGSHGFTSGRGSNVARWGWNSSNT
jgi:hypothetical protein